MKTKSLGEGGGSLKRLLPGEDEPPRFLLFPGAALLSFPRGQLLREATHSPLQFSARHFRLAPRRFARDARRSINRIEARELA